VAEGTLTVSVEQDEQVLSAGELIRVPAASRRQLINGSTEPVLFVAIGGAGRHEGRDGEAFASWEDDQGAPPAEVPMPEDLHPGPNA